MPKCVVGGWAVSASVDSAPTIASVVNSVSKRLVSADKSAVDGDLDGLLCASPQLSLGFLHLSTNTVVYIIHELYFFATSSRNYVKLIDIQNFNVQKYSIIALNKQILYLLKCI